MCICFLVDVAVRVRSLQSLEFYPFIRDRLAIVIPKDTLYSDGLFQFGDEDIKALYSFARERSLRRDCAAIAIGVGDESAE